MTGKPEHLLELQLALECKGFDHRGRLTRIPGDEPDDIALIAIAQLDQSYKLLLRADIPPDIASRIQRLDPQETFENPDTLQDYLIGWPIPLPVRRGRSYVFPQQPSTDQFADVTRLGPDDTDLLTGQLAEGFQRFLDRRTVFAVVRDGHAITACTSSPENNAAAEAWVMTDEQHRGHGYAKQVVAAWAHHILQAGKTAFYSHREDNAASAGVARSLGLREWGRTVTIGE